MEDLAGKVVFVTGAASGIGLGICRAAIDTGMKVMMADIEAAVLEKAHGLLSRDLHKNAAVEKIVCDVSDRNSVDEAAQATIERFGKVHLLCNIRSVNDEMRIYNCNICKIIVIMKTLFFSTNFQYRNSCYFTTTSKGSWNQNFMFM